MTRKHTLIILLTSILIVILGLIIYFLTSYSYVKHISLINFYDKDLELNINGSVYNLQPFDTKLIVLKDLRHLGITAKIKNEAVYTQSIELPFNSQILAFAFSEVEQCYYQTNFTNDISNLNYVQVETKDNHLIINNPDFDKTDYFLPGTNISDINWKKDVTGYLPILCSDIENKETILANNQLFLNYNAELQRKYYFEKITEINNSTNLNQLGEIKGVEKQRLNFFNFGGEIMFLNN